MTDKARRKAFRAANREKLKAEHLAWRQANREHLRAYRKAYVAAHRETLREQAGARRKANREKTNRKANERRAQTTEACRAAEKEYREANRERLRAYARAYYATNRERLCKPRERTEEARLAHRIWERAYCKAHPALFAAKRMRRHAAKLRATPVWANREKIAAFYEEASRLTKETGIPHEVDHIIPLRGKLVSGLHVETNLQVLPATINRRKQARWSPK